MSPVQSVTNVRVHSSLSRLDFIASAKNAEIASFGFRLLGVGVARRKRPAEMCGGRRQGQAPTSFSSYDQQTGFKLPFVSELLGLPRVTLFSHSFC